MIDKLPDDLILLIIYNILDINNIINLSIINKTMYKCFDDTIYIHWGRNLYSNEFWNKAQKRTPIISCPLFSMKMELLRIAKFHDYQKTLGFTLWNNEDFFKYWDAMEKIKLIKV
jgi:hypothetical protein